MRKKLSTFEVGLARVSQEARVVLERKETELRRQYYHFRFDPLPK